MALFQHPVALLLAEAASPGSKSIYHLFDYFLIAATVVFSIVTFLVLYISYRYRGKSEDPDPKQVFGNKKIEISLTLITFAVVGFYFYLTISTMISIQHPAGNQKPDVVITGHQWWWEVEYPKAGVTAANEVHLPVGKKLLIDLKSADVIHDWWVPALGRKMDMIPGRTNHLWLTIDKKGTFVGACSEYCGAEHAWMRIHVIAQSPAAFKKWEKEQEKPADSPQSYMAVKGDSLFMKSTCVNCHSIKGTPANGDVGPDLTHLGSRRTILAGMLKNNPENLTRWLDNPQNVKKGANMPNFMLSNIQVKELVTYLEGLK
ncbi:MAG TPA: cytochrome c oxidase subunit II [Balneolales bacterium]|nr:cytochrome c oxidase subunit II [Balneolales bacterium]